MFYISEIRSIHPGKYISDINYIAHCIKEERTLHNRRKNIVHCTIITKLLDEASNVRYIMQLT